MYLSFDLKTILNIEADDEQVLGDLDGCEELYIGGVHGPSVLSQMEQQYRECKMDDVAAALQIAIRLRMSPTDGQQAKTIIDFMAMIAALMFDSERPMSSDIRGRLTMIRSVGDLPARIKSTVAETTAVAS